VLPALYRHVTVPPPVIAELSRAQTPDRVRTWVANSPDWLYVQAPAKALDVVRRDLGAGERDAIGLAVEVSADALLVDDRDARREAERLGLPVLGTLRVLAERQSMVSRISQSRSLACARPTFAPAISFSTSC
jgi:uncharacterized protein